MNISAISDTQAEAAVIATLVYHPQFILHSEHLKAGYFYNLENGCLYWAIDELYKNGVDTIDALNISNMLNSNHAVKKKIEEYNLTDIQEFISMAQYAARHTLEEYRLLVNRIVETSFKRELAKLAMEIQSDCFNSDMKLSQLNKTVNTKLNKLTEKYISGEDIKMLGDRIDDIWEKFESQDISRRLPSKFGLFNDYFYYEPGELVLLTARYKTGKSVFCLNETIHMLQHGVPTLYIDTELSTETFVKRLICSVTGIPFRIIQSKSYTDEQKQQIDECIKWIHTAPLVHIYMPDGSMDDIYSICKILKYKMGLTFFVYDYIKSYNSEAYTNSAILGQMADFLKNKIAGELDLAVLSAAQLNRDDKIANSDNIAKAISTGIYWRFKSNDEVRAAGLEGGNVLAYININRNGPQIDEDEAIFFHFDGDRQRITEAKIQSKDVPKIPYDEKEKNKRKRKRQ